MKEYVAVLGEFLDGFADGNRKFGSLVLVSLFRVGDLWKTEEYVYSDA